MNAALATHPGFASHADGNEPSHAAPQLAPPSPTQLDQLIAEYEAQQKIADESQTVANALASKLIELVRKHGSVPENAGQSWRMEGVHSTATVTISTTKLLKDEHIANLLRYMHQHGLVTYFHKMFSASTRYTLIDGARDVLSGVELPMRTRDKILALFGMCLEVKDQKPRLTVKAVKPEKPARKPRKGKAVA